MTKIDNISDVNLSAVEDIGNIVFKSISTALNVTLLYFCHVLNKIIDKKKRFICVNIYIDGISKITEFYLFFFGDDRLQMLCLKKFQPFLQLEE